MFAMWFGDLDNRSSACSGRGMSAQQDFDALIQCKRENRLADNSPALLQSRG